MTIAPPENLRTAIVFFGITRSLRFTLTSIERNVIAPVRAQSPTVGIFGHFYSQDRIDNPRSGESGALDPEEYRLLPLDQAEREPPGHCLNTYPVDAIASHGDYWKDQFKSFRNLVHQLHSLHRATALAQAFQPDIVVFARPDLLYLTPMTPWLNDIAKDPSAQVMVPDWALWRGLNDRVALARGADAIAAYGHRVQRMLDFCASGRPLHSEQLLKFALAEQRIRLIPLHAARVRSDGRVVLENFEPGMGKTGVQTTMMFNDFMASQDVQLGVQG